MSGRLIGVFLEQLVGQLPILLVALAGAVVSIVMVQRARSAAPLALLGCLLLLCRVLVAALSGFPAMWLGFGVTFPIVMNLIAGLMFAVGLGLVIAAALVGRSRGEPRQ